MGARILFCFILLSGFGASLREPDDPATEWQKGSHRAGAMGFWNRALAKLADG